MVSSVNTGALWLQRKSEKVTTLRIPAPVSSVIQKRNSHGKGAGAPLSDCQLEREFSCPWPLGRDACEATDECSVEEAVCICMLSALFSELVAVSESPVGLQSMQLSQPDIFCLNCRLTGISPAPPLSFQHQKIFNCHKKEVKLGIPFFFSAGLHIFPETGCSF